MSVLSNSRRGPRRRAARPPATTESPPCSAVCLADPQQAQHNQQ